jgi:hypothetical protein
MKCQMSGYGLLADFNSINYADDGGVNWTVFAAKGQASGTALHYQNQFSKTRPHSVYNNNMALFVIAFYINEPRN